MIGLPVPVAVWPPVLVTVYPVIGLPPLDGAEKETVAEALPAVATTLAGAPGAVAGQILIVSAGTGRHGLFDGVAVLVCNEPGVHAGQEAGLYV